VISARFSGINGDVLGASILLTETIALIATVAVMAAIR
jgi:cobalamin synthase